MSLSGHKSFTSHHSHHQQSSRLQQAFRFVTYVPAECSVDTTPIGGAIIPSESQKSLKSCSYSINTRRRVIPFGYKYVMKLEIAYKDSIGNMISKSINLTGRQFLVRANDHTYVKAKYLRLGDQILLRLDDQALVSAEVINILHNDAYKPVMELAVSDKEIFSIENVLSVALSRTKKKQHPVVSHGVIAYYIDCTHSKCYYLIVRRRHTMAFLDFIRGKYFNNDRDHMCKLYLSQMTSDERCMISNMTFSQLWNIVWGNPINDPPNTRFMHQYEKSLKRWKELDLDMLMKDVTIHPFQYPEYGWPKGRSNKNETSEQTALREFSEETGLDPAQKFIEVDRRISPSKLTESFLGNNGIRYDHFYTLARFKSEPTFRTMLTPNNAEIGSVEFRSYDDCMRLFRPDDTSKRHLLSALHLDITNHLGHHPDTQ